MTFARCAYVSIERGQMAHPVLTHYSSVDGILSCRASLGDGLGGQGTGARGAGKARVARMLNTAVNYRSLPVMSVVARRLSF
jgi:hypothetical protein